MRTPFGEASPGADSPHVRKSGCGLPGCGKPRHDPIHQQAG